MKRANKFFQLTIALALLLVFGEVPNLFAAANVPPDLEVQITQGGESVTTGSIFSYIIVVTNIGGDLPANNAALEITPPTQGMIIGTAQDGDACLQVGDVLNCPLGTLNAGDKATVEIQFQAPNDPTLLSLTATASESESGLPEDLFDNNTASVDTEVVADDDGNDVVDNNGGCILGGSGTTGASWYLLGFISLLGLRFSKKRG